MCGPEGCVDGSYLFAHFVIIQISADVSCRSHVALSQVLCTALFTEVSLGYFKLIMLVSQLKSSLTCINIPHPLRMRVLIHANSTLTERLLAGVNLKPLLCLPQHRKVNV